jgi:hypothetical protein
MDHAADRTGVRRTASETVVRAGVTDTDGPVETWGDTAAPARSTAISA